MALLINPASPLGSDAPSTIDDQIRAFKQAIVDIFGVPSNTTVAQAAFGLTASGLATVRFIDSAANQSTTGYLGRNSRALSYFDGGQAARLSTVIASSFAAVGNVGGGEDDLRTVSLAASTLFEDGRALRVTGAGFTAANATAKTIRFYIGATSLTINPTTTNPNNLSWFCEFLIGRSGAATQVLRGGIAMIGAAQEITNLSLAGVATLSGAVTFKFTGAGGADNDIVQNVWLVEVLG